MTTSQEHRTGFWAIFWPAIAGGAFFFALLVAGYVLSPENIVPVTHWSVMMAFCGGIPVALGGLLWSLVKYARGVRRQITDLNIDTFLDDAELYAVTLCGYCPGYRGGWWCWNVSGVLGLTDSELVFRTSPGNFRNHDWRISLVEIRSVERCRVSFSNCGIRVTSRDGSNRYLIFSFLVGTLVINRLIQVIWFARSRLTN